MKINGISILSWVLLVIGGLNWGLVGLFGFNLVEALFNDWIIARTIYILVGIAAAYSLISMFKKNSSSTPSAPAM